ACCHDGSDHRAENPPPVTPSPMLEPFHANCWEGAVRLGMVVPPTPVTLGWLAGSSTARALVPQSVEPLSPAAAKVLMPSCAAVAKIGASSVGSGLPVSQAPQLVEMMVTDGLSTIAW